MAMSSVDVGGSGAQIGTAPLSGEMSAPLRSNDDTAAILLALARDLLRDSHPAISHLIRYALLELGETRN